MKELAEVGLQNSVVEILTLTVKIEQDIQTSLMIVVWCGMTIVVSFKEHPAVLVEELTMKLHSNHITVHHHHHYLQQLENYHKFGKMGAL